MTEPILLLGSGRSGTTWILDALASANGLRTIFEPLNPVPLPRAKPFANKYFGPHDHHPELKAYMDQVLYGAFSSTWTNYRYSKGALSPARHPISSSGDAYLLAARYKRFFARFLRYQPRRFSRRIVKFIRANLMIGWLRTHYQAGMLLVLRHPAAVISSKMQRGGRFWSFGQDVQQEIYRGYLGDDSLRKSYFNGFDADAVAKDDEVTGHAVMWCVENVHAYSTACQMGIPMTFYEELLLDREKEFSKMCSLLGLKAPDATTLCRPSQQSSRDMKAQPTPIRSIERWKTTLNAVQQEKIHAVLEAFGVDFYAMNDPLPTRRASGA
jgi:hypothetical protein